MIIDYVLYLTEIFFRLLIMLVGSFLLYIFGSKVLEIWEIIPVLEVAQILTVPGSPLTSGAKFLITIIPLTASLSGFALLALGLYLLVKKIRQVPKLVADYPLLSPVNWAFHMLACGFVCFVTVPAAFELTAERRKEISLAMSGVRETATVLKKEHKTEAFGENGATVSSGWSVTFQIAELEENDLIITKNVDRSVYNRFKERSAVEVVYPAGRPELLVPAFILSPKSLAFHTFLTFVIVTMAAYGIAGILATMRRFPGNPEPMVTKDRVMTRAGNMSHDEFRARYLKPTGSKGSRSFGRR